MRWLVVLVLLVSAPARSQPQPWTIVPPHGWQEDAARAEGLRTMWSDDVYAQSGPAHVWKSPKGSTTLLLKWVYLRTARPDPAALISSHLRRILRS